ncbi:MAG: sensor domain-containing diguanylate cyclase [Burkholderiales bacterium PBB3]|nr:MAG: sensor domain-containing diguanylate cyclase [Burkholderiales bacterium PBB3]
MVTRLTLWLGRLSVGRKLTLIYLLDLCAVIYVSGILIHEKYIAIDFARKEIVGVTYIEVVRANLMATFMLPAKAAPAATAGQPPPPTLPQVREAYDALLQTTDRSARFAELLQNATTAPEAQKTQLLNEGRVLLTTVGNQSNLILDPDLDSYYVMSLTLLRFPELLQILHDTHKFMQSRDPKASGQSQTAQLLNLAGRLDAALLGIEADYGQAWLAGSPQLKAALQASRSAVMEQARLFGSQVQDAASGSAAANQDAALQATYQGALVALNGAWQVAVVELQGLLHTRVEGLFSRMWLHLGTALLLLGCILSLVYMVASQIARPLQKLARVADDVRRSTDYTRRAEWHSRDEIGQLFTAFNGMLAQLDQDRLVQQELAASASAAAAQRELVEAFPIPMVVTSVPDHEVLHANGPAQPWLGGITRDPWRVGLDSSVRGRFFQRLADSGAVDEFEVRWAGGASPSWAVLSARRLKYQGRDAVLTAFTPINKLKVMEQRLELWAKVFEASGEGIIIMDESRRIISVNRAFCRSTGYDFYEAIGKDLGFLVNDAQESLWSGLQANESWQGEVHVQKQSGDTYPAWLMVSAVRKSAVSGEVVNYIGISIDITDRKVKEERIRFLAHHDVLTELPNRAMCHQRLAEALAQARQTGEKVGVLFLDLDRFKLINDTLGHHIGDGLLRTVARRLTQAVRADDTVCRLGGDEFVIVMRHVSGRDELDATVNQRLIPSIRQNTLVEGHNLTVSCSVGVALYPDDSTDQEELMRQADAAMYEAKTAGRDMARFFSPETDQRVLARQTMEGQLRQALGNQEFSLHYQPRLTARTRRLQGAEALLRWNNPVLGNVPPANFIQLAEETGLIKPIGLWVVREACTQWMRYQQDGLFEGIELSVNVSVAQLSDPDLVGQLQEVLQQTGMPPGLLELELTESHLMDNPLAAQEQVAALKALGVQIAIDDFGTGYSSLAYLKRFEIDKLKVDQSFVQSMLDDSADAAIVHAVIALGHTLGLKVVAEGVENLPTAQTLTALGCDELQGYCFSRPLSAGDFEAWVRVQDDLPQRRKVR